jgi:hypothetical protein
MSSKLFASFCCRYLLRGGRWLYRNDIVIVVQSLKVFKILNFFMSEINVYDETATPPYYHRIVAEEFISL